VVISRKGRSKRIYIKKKKNHGKRNPLIIADEHTCTWSPLKRTYQLLEECGMKIVRDETTRFPKFKVLDILSLAEDDYSIEVSVPDNYSSAFLLSCWWPFLHYCIENNCYLVGCDLSAEDTFYLLDPMNPVSQTAMEESCAIREEHAAKTILKYVQRSAQPIISIHGNAHIHHQKIYDIFEQNNFSDYMVIEQVPDSS